MNEQEIKECNLEEAKIIVRSIWQIRSGRNTKNISTVFSEYFGCFYFRNL